MNDGTTYVVIPAFNEADCITEVVTAVRSAGYPCIVVDDASTDATAALADAAGATVVGLPINLGVGGALRAGWKMAIHMGATTAVQVDADGQHPVEQIDDLLAHLTSHHLDMVVGSRFLPDGSYVPVSQQRRSAQRMLSWVLHRRAGVRLTDPTSGFRAIHGDLLAAFAADFPHHFLGDTFEALLVAGRRGYAIGEIPVHMRARQGGRPSANLAASVRAMVRAMSLPIIGCTFDVPPRGSA